MKYIFICFFSFVLLGCASGLDITLPDKYTEDNDQPKGYLVGMIGATRALPASGEALTTTLMIRQIGDNETISLTNDNSHSDFKTPSLLGQLFILPLPAGEYELYRIVIEGSNGNQTFYTSSTGNLALKFRITEDTANYIGEFIAISRVVKSQLWNLEYPSGRGYFKHGYDAKRDSALFYQLKPDLKAINFQTKELAVIRNRLIYSDQNQ